MRVMKKGRLREIANLASPTNLPEKVTQRKQLKEPSIRAADGSIGRLYANPFFSLDALLHVCFFVGQRKGHHT